MLYMNTIKIDNDIYLSPSDQELLKDYDNFTKSMEENLTKQKNQITEKSLRDEYSNLQCYFGIHFNNTARLLIKAKDNIALKEEIINKFTKINKDLLERNSFGWEALYHYEKLNN